MDDAPPVDLQIPTDWAAVTPEWMSAALAPAFGDLDVSAIELRLVDDGTNRRARYGVAYSRGAGPETVFLKAADPDHAALNLATGGLFNEPRLFNAGIILPIEHPSVYLALIDEPELNFLLVMEDITARGGEPRDSTQPLTLEQASNGVVGLAHLHSAFWGRVEKHPGLSWVESLVAWEGMGGGIAVGLKRTEETNPPEVLALTGEQIERDLWFPYIATVNTGPQTLLHGDPHVGNTYVLPDGEVGFLDWQVLRRGNFSIDLGYFVQGALTIEDRRNGEADLIAAYHEALAVPAEHRPTRDEIWLRYRASVAHGLALWMATASSDDWQRPEVSLPLAQRYAAAFADLETATAIAQLTAR